MPRSPVEPPSRPDWLAAVVAVAALVGLGTSALLLYLYLAPAAGSCGPDGGCDSVRTSPYSAVAGIPLPYLGLAYFGALAAVLWVPRLRHRGVLLALGIAGLAAGATLLVLQGVIIGAWCPYCIVVDGCALAAGLVAAPGLADPGVRVPRTAAVAAVGLGVAAPAALFTALHSPVEPPDPYASVAPAIATATDQATVVEYIDFECPFCRRQYHRLKTILADYGDRVRVVYRHLPLSMHPHAREAARFACCAEEQGRGREMVDALFSRADLSTAGCLDAAERIGLHRASLDECLDSTRPDALLDAHADEAREAGVRRRLPTCFIGGQRFVGVQDVETLRAAIDAALEPPGASS